MIPGRLPSYWRIISTMWSCWIWTCPILRAWKYWRWWKRKIIRCRWLFLPVPVTWIWLYEPWKMVPLITWPNRWTKNTCLRYWQVLWKWEPWNSPWTRCRQRSSKKIWTTRLLSSICRPRTQPCCACFTRPKPLPPEAWVCLSGGKEVVEKKVWPGEFIMPVLVAKNHLWPLIAPYVIRMNFQVICLAEPRIGAVKKRK